MPTHFAILAVDLGSGPGPGTQIFCKVYKMFQMPVSWQPTIGGTFAVFQRKQQLIKTI